MSVKKFLVTNDVEFMYDQLFIPHEKKKSGKYRKNHVILLKVNGSEMQSIFILYHRGLLWTLEEKYSSSYYSCPLQSDILDESELLSIIRDFKDLGYCALLVKNALGEYQYRKNGRSFTEYDFFCDSPVILKPAKRNEFAPIKRTFPRDVHKTVLINTL